MSAAQLIQRILQETEQQVTLSGFFVAIAQGFSLPAKSHPAKEPGNFNVQHLQVPLEFESAESRL